MPLINDTLPECKAPTPPGKGRGLRCIGGVLWDRRCTREWQQGSHLLCEKPAINENAEQPCNALKAHAVRPVLLQLRRCRVLARPQPTAAVGAARLWDWWLGCPLAARWQTRRALLAVPCSAGTSTAYLPACCHALLLQAPSIRSLLCSPAAAVLLLQCCWALHCGGAGAAGPSATKRGQLSAKRSPQVCLPLPPGMPACWLLHMCAGCQSLGAVRLHGSKLTTFPVFLTQGACFLAFWLCRLNFQPQAL